MPNLYMKGYNPSSVNSFIEYRAKFYMEKILGMVSPSNLDMERGKCVEAALNIILKGGEKERAIEYVLVEWDKATISMGEKEDRDEKRATLEPLVEAGIKALAKYGKFKASQRKIKVDIDGFSLPWTGYVDYDFEDDVIVDLKITGTTPSSLRGAHARQGSFYHKHTPENKKVYFLYLVPLKKEMKAVEFELVDIDIHYNHLLSAARTMDRLLSITNGNLLEDIFFPNLGCYTMNDEEFRKNINDIWFNIGD